MKKQILATTIASLLSVTAVAAEQSYYQNYFDINTVQDLLTQTRLYNEENGYWENGEVVNRELVRYLDQIKAEEAEEAEAVAEAAAQREVNGYWN